MVRGGANSNNSKKLGLLSAPYCFMQVRINNLIIVLIVEFRKENKVFLIYKEIKRDRVQSHI